MRNQNRSTIFLFFIAVFVWLNETYSQEVAPKSDYLIQFDSEKSSVKFTESFRHFRADYKTEIITRHVPIVSLYAPGLSYDDLVEMLRNTEGVMAFQTNKKIELRATVPNDPRFFTDQWNMNIINAPQAWDFNTGGVTAAGHEIVVAVADDGFAVDHPDLIDNLFTNRFEIPNNGIDDDLNGFIDDIHGANMTTNNGVHEIANHGTGVLGIIGARGNNGIGMTGINWSVRLMPLSNALRTESSLFKAYDYIASMRSLFNSTEGEEGALIVATNLSGGISNKFPEDSPIWCNWYDILGSHGILNVGATANSNVDVDVVGDLPSTCPSDYLIMVTNTTALDVKASNAGFGSISVDLGAPGDGNISTNRQLDYGTFNSTSCATPHVTGAVALMYSIPGSGIDFLYRNSPAEAASAVKRAILEGVNPINSLIGKTTTGGRLNLANMITKYSDVAKASHPLNFLAWPNPVQDILTIELGQYLVSELVVEVFEANGNVVYSRLFKSSEVSDNIKLDVGHLMPGIYVCRITSSTLPGVVRFIKN